MIEDITDWNEFVSYSIGTVKTKVCIKCNLDLPLSSYALSGGTSYLRTECINCNKKLNKVRQKNKKNTPYPTSDYMCPICGRNEDQVKGMGNKNNGAWALDHNNKDSTKTGVRKYLCHPCNRGIGNFGEDTDRLHRAIQYLKEF
jgi:hypothetical protein